MVVFLVLPNFVNAAVVQLNSSVMQTGGEYNSLASWYAAMTANGGLDLTSSSTKVFSHGGITGSIPDGTFVTGSISGATGIAVHVTTNKILIKNITGTFQSSEKVQVDLSNYVTISNVGDSVILAAKIDGAWSAPETTNILSLDKVTTSATNYVKIFTTTTARHNGKWSDTAYTFAPTSFGHFDIKDDYVDVNGLQILAPSENSDVVFASDPADVQSLITISNCIFSGGGNGARLMSVTRGGTTKLWNNLFFDWTGQGTGIDLNYNAQAYLYNNTIYGMGIGIANDNSDGSGQHLINNLANNNGVDYAGNFASDSANNLSMDASSPNPSFQNKTVSFVDPGNKSFFLSSADTVAIDQGANLSADANISFNTDIAKNTRPQGAAWDIGANEYAASNPNSLPPVTYTITASAGTGGTITPLGMTTLGSGSTQGYSIVPDSGYVISSLDVDGIILPGQDAYKFSNLGSNHTISVTFFSGNVAPSAPSGLSVL